MRFRGIGSVSLNLVWSAPRTAPLASHWRNSFHQGQQLGHIMTISSSQESRQGNPFSVSNHMVFAPQLAPVSGVGAGFFPRHPRRELRRYPLRLVTNQSHPLPLVGPAAIHVVAAKLQPPANLEGGVSRSFPNHIPSPEATSPRECRSSGRTGCQSGLGGRPKACDLGSAGIWAWVVAVRAEPIPIAHHLPVVLPCVSPLALRRN